MHGPDGTDYPNKTVYQIVEPPHRLVYTNAGSREGGPGARFEATVTFEDWHGKTRLTLSMRFDEKQSRDLVVREYGAVEGGKQTLARLREVLKSLAH